MNPNNPNGVTLYNRTFSGQLSQTFDRVRIGYSDGEYSALTNFLSTLSKIQSGMINDGVVVLDEGIKFDTNTLGGLSALQTYMETLTSQKEIVTGLSKAGLKYESKFWTLQ